MRLRRALERIYELDPTGLSGLVRLLVRSVRLLILAPREFIQDRGLQWAGSLSFSTLLALVPVGVLVLLVANLFDVDELVTQLLIERGLPDAAGQAGPAIENIIQSARANANSMGFITLGFLLFVAYGLFADLERAVGHVWKTRRGRTFVGRLRAFAFLLIFGPILFGGSIWVTARLHSPAVLAESGLAPAGQFLLRTLPFIVTWIAFFVLYSYLPVAKVRLRSAILAALVAGSTWELAKRGFNLYVSNAVTIDQFYGTIGIVPITLLWLYITWIIVLFGVEMAYVDQNFDALVHGIRGKGAERGAAREVAAVRLVLELARSRRASRREPEAAVLSADAGIRPETADELLDALHRAEILVPLSRKRYRLARDDDAIELADIVAAVRGPIPTLRRGGSPSRLDRCFDEGERSRHSALASTTIADLLEEESSAADSPEDETNEEGTPT